MPLRFNDAKSLEDEYVDDGSTDDASSLHSEDESYLGREKSEEPSRRRSNRLSAIEKAINNEAQQLEWSLFSVLFSALLYPALLLQQLQH